MTWPDADELAAAVPPEPLVSILINNHNYGRYLRACIASALEQSYRPVEVIVVDNSSNDATPQEVPRRYGLVCSMGYAGERDLVNAMNRTENHAKIEDGLRKYIPLAAKAGLSADVIADLKAGNRPSKMADDEALVYDFVTELTTTQKVSDETFARAKKVFNDQQIVDLTAVAGNYVMVAMMLAMAEETTPPGKEPPFKASEK